MGSDPKSITQPLTPGSTSYLTLSPSLGPRATPPGNGLGQTPPRYHYHQKHSHRHDVIADPSGRFERYDQILGRGAYKKVYIAFDHEEGVEVAWNEIKVDHLRRQDRRKIWSEISILKTLRHDSVINLFHAWTAMNQHGIENIYFVTELMSSGTLRQFIKKTKGPIKPRVLKNWCIQILRGLDYLHRYDPPIIHRDLKCDNIFVNGNSGHLKIGDLGLATFKHREHASSVLGTPEYMAPEMYEERYDEKVDIYAFGMCVLEMVTKDYPYAECTNPAQIYRRVTNGIEPAALGRLTDPDVHSFIRHCIQPKPTKRPTAAELLQHSFLNTGHDLWVVTDLSSTTGANLGFPLTSLPGVSPSVTPNGMNVPTRGGPQGSSPNLSVPLPVSATPPTTNQVPPTLSSRSSSTSSHSTANASALPRNPTVSVEVLFFNIDLHELNLEVRCVAPNADPQVVSFPFHLTMDTPYSVVVEMIREGVLGDTQLPMAEEEIARVLDIWFDREVQKNRSLLGVAHRYPYFNSTARSLGGPLAFHSSQERAVHFQQTSENVVQSPLAATEETITTSSEHQLPNVTISSDQVPDKAITAYLSDHSPLDGEDTLSELELDTSSQLKGVNGTAHGPDAFSGKLSDPSARQRHPPVFEARRRQTAKSYLTRRASEKSRIIGRRSRQPGQHPIHALPQSKTCSTPCSPIFQAESRLSNPSDRVAPRSGSRDTLRRSDALGFSPPANGVRQLCRQGDNLSGLTSPLSRAIYPPPTIPVDLADSLTELSLGEPMVSSALDLPGVSPSDANPHYSPQDPASAHTPQLMANGNISSSDSDPGYSADESVGNCELGEGLLPSPPCSNYSQPIPVPRATSVYPPPSQQIPSSYQDPMLIGLRMTSVPVPVSSTYHSDPNMVESISASTACDPLPDHPTSLPNHIAQDSSALGEGSTMISGYTMPPPGCSDDPDVRALWCRQQHEAATLFRNHRMEWSQLLALKNKELGLNSTTQKPSERECNI
ncbi:hypothetical protein IWQ61_002198 [Dispira simplex]|nr:hypothetical protein IWQ61_002198 [Dispira simplex]